MKKENLEHEIRELKNARDLDSFIEKNGTNLGEFNWHLITKSPAFNMKMVDKYADHLDWQWLTTFSELSENLIEKYIGYVDWYSVSTFQKLNYNFIKKYKDLLSMDKVVSNEHVIKDKDHLKIIALYDKIKDDPKYQKIWADNLDKNSIFKPSNFNVSIKPALNKNKKVKQASAPVEMTKDEMKKILQKRGVKVLYHDTVDILKRKLRKSERK
jgi:hypothetical protein